LFKKGISVWVFSSLTFISLLHLIEAISVVLFSNQTRLLQLYPLIGEELQTMPPMIYLLASAIVTVTFWGITCAIMFDNPVEAFLNKILSDAKTQTAVESQLIEQKSEILDVMSDTIESNSDILAQVADTVYNVRTEVKEIQPIKETVEKIKTELNNLRKEVKRLDEKEKSPGVCAACGKPLLPEFKICPYCGENVKLQTPVLALKDYK
jgi:RNA polymerase-binding transcription factor DksA